MKIDNFHGINSEHDGFIEMILKKPHDSKKFELKQFWATKQIEHEICLISFSNEKSPPTFDFAHLWTVQMLRNKKVFAQFIVE